MNGSATRDWCRGRPLRRRRQKTRGFTEAFATEILSEIEALVGPPIEEWDFEAIEVAARRKALRLAAVALPDD